MSGCNSTFYNYFIIICYNSFSIFPCWPTYLFYLIHAFNVCFFLSFFLSIFQFLELWFGFQLFTRRIEIEETTVSGSFNMLFLGHNIALGYRNHTNIIMRYIGKSIWSFALDSDVYWVGYMNGIIVL